MNIQVSYCDFDGNFKKGDDIQGVSLLFKSDKLIVLSLQTKSKYPEARLYWGSGFSYEIDAESIANFRVNNLGIDDKDGISVMFQSNRYGGILILMSNSLENDSKNMEFEILAV